MYKIFLKTAAEKRFTVEGNRYLEEAKVKKKKEACCDERSGAFWPEEMEFLVPRVKFEREILRSSNQSTLVCLPKPSFNCDSFC